MTIMEISMLTGFHPNEDDLKQLTSEWRCMRSSMRPRPVPVSAPSFSTGKGEAEGSDPTGRLLAGVCREPLPLVRLPVVKATWSVAMSNGRHHEVSAAGSFGWTLPTWPHLPPPAQLSHREGTVLGFRVHTMLQTDLLQAALVTGYNYSQRCSAFYHLPPRRPPCEGSATSTSAEVPKVRGRERWAAGDQVSHTSRAVPAPEEGRREAEAGGAPGGRVRGGRGLRV
ncbi:uncharacterized protein LOC110599220 isoform X1 [Ictidomys tridecemlineatus]